jgi:hypothetical protein
MNFLCPNSLVGQDRYWAALEERRDGVLAVADEDTSSLGAEGALVND